MPRTAVLFAILFAAALQAQTAPAQPPAGQQQTPPATQPPAPPSSPQTPPIPQTPPTQQTPPPAPQPSTQPPAQQAPAAQTPATPTLPVRQSDPDRDTELMLLDRVQKLANDALAGQSKDGKVTVDRASLNEIIAAAMQVKTSLQR